MRRFVGLLVGEASLISIMLFVAACTAGPAKTPTTSGTNLTMATNAPSTTVPASASTATTAPAVRGVPATPTLTIPQPLVKNRAALNNTRYVVFAWNDLGMHCANPSFDTLVLLPPYNTLWAQIVKRGNPPQIVTTGLSVQYKFVNNTYSYGKGGFSGFWDNVKALFGTQLNRDTGLNLKDAGLHNGLTGSMVARGDHFEAVGVPLTPINDDGSWNPFQVAIVTVKDTSGAVVAQTDATAPVSDEIDCAKCHGSSPFQDILQKHDKNTGSNLVSSEPVLCASCHGDPALGTPKSDQIEYLSAAVHRFHSSVSPQPACYDCHPGQQTQCSRSLAHTTPDGNCITCHGDLAKVGSSADSGRTPWANEPVCVTCHAGVAEVDTQSTLYRNATGHGGVHCASCHSSPHAMVPSRVISDNYQALQYEGAEKTIGSCGACHASSRGEGINEYAQRHGGVNPATPNACNICHTSVSADTRAWPHGYQWKATQGSGTAGGDD